MITLIICALNEARSIRHIIRQSKKYADEILVVDGHSSDGTVRIALQEGVRVLPDGRKGKGEAIRVGLAAAHGSIIVFMDADGSHDPGDIPMLVRPIVSRKADLVVASRGKGGSDELSGSFEKNLRMMGSLVITTVVNLRFRVHLTDTQNGFRAIRKKTAIRLNLEEDIFTIEQEMIIKALKGGYRLDEVPSHEYARLYGQSHIELLTMSWRYVWSLLKYII